MSHTTTTPRSGFNDQGYYWHGKPTWRSPFLHNNPGMGWFQKCDFPPKEQF